MRFLIAYDIADPRRLSRVACYLEKHAVRCQKSVFMADMTEQELVHVLDEVATAAIRQPRSILWRLIPVTDYVCSLYCIWTAKSDVQL